ncbi:MAG TPA: M13 family peptidase, partial [Allosphingosinicella sp.]
MKKCLAFGVSLIAFAAAPAAARHGHDCLDEACAIQALIQPQPEGGAAATVEAKRYGSWGLDTAGMDRSAKPGDDFYAYANGTWAKTTQIPADRSSYGAFAVLRELSEARLKTLVEGYRPGAAGDEGKVAELYRGFLDEAAA